MHFILIRAFFPLIGVLKFSPGNSFPKHLNPAKRAVQKLEVGFEAGVAGLFVFMSALQLGLKDRYFSAAVLS